MKLIIICLLLLCIQSSYANTSYSPYRKPELSWQVYRDNYKRLSNASAVKSAKKLAKINFKSLPIHKVDLQQIFEYVRDKKFLIDNDGRLRRSTWLFPDDGCYARAALMNENIKSLNISMPQKIFVFGDLAVRTPNSYKGYVTWWYHVAPVIRTTEGVFVLDPAIEPLHPLKIKDWLSRMGVPNSFEISICSGQSYMPNSKCFDNQEKQLSVATYDQKFFLDFERERLLELGRNPNDELGDFPPWLKAKSELPLELDFH